MICYNVDQLGISCQSHTHDGAKRGYTWCTSEHRSVSRLTSDPFHFPCEHVPKPLIHLGEVSPVRCRSFEFDTRLAIVE